MFPRVAVWTITAACCIVWAGMSVSAQAAPVADPGFVFVDVNNDGLYAPEDGDIGLASSPSVDINGLILNNGSFNTQVSEGTYQAPCHPVSLVVPASQNLTTPFSLNLNAGENLLVYGSLSAPIIYLSADNTVDMTGSFTLFGTLMKVCAGGNATLESALITSLDVVNNSTPVSKLYVQSCNDVLANQAVIATGLMISFEAQGGISASYAGFTTSEAASSAIRFLANQQVQATDTAASTGGTFTARSWCSGVDFAGLSLIAGKVNILANADVNLIGSDTFGSSISASSSVNIQAYNKVNLWNSAYPLASAVTGSSLSIKGDCDVEASYAFLNATVGGVTLTSVYGMLTMHSAFVSALGSFSASGSGGLSATGAGVVANGNLRFTAANGTMDLSGSFVQPQNPSILTTNIQAVSACILTANGIDWTAPARITLKSNWEDIYAQNAYFRTPSTRITANGRDIYVNGALFDGTVVYAPSGVRVYGP
jgi:hypothetical protein